MLPDAANHASREYRASLRRLDAHRPARIRTGSHRRDAVAQVAPFARGDVIARDPESAHAIAAIRRRLDIEDRVVEIERRPQIAAHGEILRKFHDAVVLAT